MDQSLCAEYVVAREDSFFRDLLQRARVRRRKRSRIIRDFMSEHDSPTSACLDSRPWQGLAVEAEILTETSFLGDFAARPKHRR